MNQRIRELAKKANPASKEIYESDNWQFNCAAWSAEDLEKFAELIVKECEVALNPMLRDMVSRGHAVDLIKKHFGVEE